jgi:polyferredoxin
MNLPLADAVLVLHVAIVLFIVGGEALILIGHWRGWPWVRGWTFRLLHLAAILVVVSEAWLGITCPLTTLETSLRNGAGAPGYDDAFVAHWLQRLLYWNAPAWVFTLVYSMFGVLVAFTWWICPPRRQFRKTPSPSPA